MLTPSAGPGVRMQDWSKQQEALGSALLCLWRQSIKCLILKLLVHRGRAKGFLFICSAIQTLDTPAACLACISRLQSKGLFSRFLLKTSTCSLQGNVEVLGGNLGCMWS